MYWVCVATSVFTDIVIMIAQPELIPLFPEVLAEEMELCAIITAPISTASLIITITKKAYDYICHCLLGNSCPMN